MAEKNCRFFLSLYIYIVNDTYIDFYSFIYFQSQASLNSSFQTGYGEILPDDLVYSYNSKRNPGFKQVESYIGFYYMTLFNLKTNVSYTISVNRRFLT